MNNEDPKLIGPDIDAVLARIGAAEYLGLVLPRSEAFLAETAADPNRIGATLARHREQQGLTLEQQAEMLGIGITGLAGNRRAFGSTIGIQTGPTERRRACRVEPGSVSPGAIAGQDLRSVHPARTTPLPGFGVGPNCVPKVGPVWCRLPAGLLNAA